MLNDSKKISAVCSRFSGGFSGGSVCHNRRMPPSEMGVEQEIIHRSSATQVGDTHQEEVMILRLCTEILEDRLLPITLHVIPIVNLSMANGIIHSVAWGLRIRESFIADKEIEILNTALRGEMPGL